MAKRPNWRKVKKHRSYTVDEVSRLLGVHKGTVRRWRYNGLQVLDDQRPLLIIGSDLIAFLQAQTPTKQKCAPHECYCLKCRRPRAPAFGEAEFTPDKAHSGLLRALCEVCATIMHKRASHAQYRDLRAILAITITQEEKTLIEC
ncbi:MAG: helix-turn-helix domain-containing protein [Hyphomicrobiales bacterium]